MLKKLSPLISAAVLAQLITFFSLPFISRIISPQEFGLFFFYSSIAGLIGGISTAKIEQLFFSSNISSIAKLLNYSYKFIVITVLLSTLIILILLSLNVFSSISWYLIPLGIFSTAVIIPHYFYLLKIQNMKVISDSRILLAVFQAVLQISFCYFYANHISLLFGLFIAQLISGTFLYIHIRRDNKKRTKTLFNPVRLDYKLMFYGVLSSALQTLNTSFLPSFFVVFKYLDLSGLIAAIHRLFMVPVNLIASAVSHFVLSEYNNAPLKVISGLWLLLLSVIFINIICYFFITEIGLILVWFLGEQWQGVKELIKYFIVLYSFIFLSVIINQACVAQKLQSLTMYLELLKLLAILFAFLIVSYQSKLDILNWYSVMLTIAMIISVITPLYILQVKLNKDCKKN